MAPGGRGNRSSLKQGPPKWRSKNRYQTSSQRFAVRRNPGSSQASSSRPSLAPPSSRIQQSDPSVVSSPTAYVRAVRSRASHTSQSVPPLSLNGTSLEDQTEDSLCETIMALEMKQRATIGCCYYVAAEETLFLMQDVPLGSNEIVEQRAPLS